MNKKNIKKIKLISVSLLSLVFLSICLFLPSANAQSIADVAKILQDQLPGITKVMEGGSYVFGISLVIKGLFKLKEHNESNGQVKLSMPIIIIICGIVLLTLGGAITTGRESLFGAGGGAGGGTGISSNG